MTEKLVERINSEHRLCRDALRTTLEHAVNVGVLLIEAKAHVNHGEWEKWIKDNCEFSARSAQGYMRAARMLPDLKAQRVADLSLREALAALAEPASRLEDLEKDLTPERVHACLDGAAALKEIREGQVYREGGYPDFETYCADRWGLEPEQAHQWIALFEEATGAA